MPSPLVTLLPSSLNFGTEKLFHSSAPQTVTLSNGDGPLKIYGWAIGPDFKIVSTNCPLWPPAVPPGQSCSFQIVFEPQSVGTKNEQLRVTDSAINSPQIVSLHGVGSD